MEELSKMLKEDPPKRGVIYHYTNFTGLHGIITNKYLWRTSFRLSCAICKT